MSINKIKFEGKTLAYIETSREKKKVELLITNRMFSLLGLDLKKHPGIKLDIKTTSLPIQNLQEDPNMMGLKKRFHEKKPFIGQK